MVTARLHAADALPASAPPRTLELGPSGYIAGALLCALAVALWALRHQRELRRRFARQAAELAESKALLADAQQFARVGHWQRTLLPAEGPLEWSDETFRIFERDPGLGPPAKIEDSLGATTSADRLAWGAAIRRARDDGAVFELEVAIEPRPGVRKILHILGRPTRDDTGRVAALFGTVQDITRWRAAEDALRQSERLLHALYDTLPYALGVVELDGLECVIVSLNAAAAQLLELSAPFAVGRALSNLGLPPERVRYWADLVACCRESGAALKTELVREEPHREFVVTLLPVGRAASGRPQFCFLAEDVTARRQKDAEISQGRRLRAIGELVGGIAHEFNNLLTPILLKSHLLMAEWSHEPALCSELKTMADTARRSAELTRRLLMFGRRTNDAAELFALRTVIDGNFNLLRPTIDRRIALESELPAALPPLWLNAGDVQQIFLNLLLNARDTLIDKLGRQPAEEWHPRVRLTGLALPAVAAQPLDSAKPSPEQWIKVTCEDNGLGMAPDVIERVFEPFYTTKQVGQGTGLGLATVWHLVVEMGGRVEIQSVPGEGTAVHVFLPVLPPSSKPSPASRPAPSAPAAPPPPPRPGTSSERVHLLVVEDEDSVATLITQILRHLGYAVTLASDGREGWSKLTANPAAYDALILDLNMPGLTGTELLQRARGLPYERPVVIISGRIADHERKALVLLRASAIVDKPFTVETFTAALAAAGLSPHRPTA